MSHHYKNELSLSIEFKLIILTQNSQTYLI
jgi:hypothetical protein